MRRRSPEPADDDGSKSPEAGSEGPRDEGETERQSKSGQERSEDPAAQRETERLTQKRVYTARRTLDPVEPEKGAP